MLMETEYAMKSITAKTKPDQKKTMVANAKTETKMEMVFVTKQIGAHPQKELPLMAAHHPIEMEMEYPTIKIIAQMKLAELLQVVLARIETKMAFATILINVQTYPGSLEGALPTRMEMASQMRKTAVTD
jgi:hypothetical protein